jgi:chromosome segregation ATPase
MARVKGRDVVLDLMDGFQELRLEVDQHRERLAAMESTQGELVTGFRELANASRATATQLHAVTTHLNLVTERMNEVTERMNEVTERMNEVTGRMNEVTERMNGVEGRVDGLTAQVERLTVLAERQQDQFAESRRSYERQSAILGDLSEVLGKIVRGTRSRIEDHEARLQVLEKKKAS